MTISYLTSQGTSSSVENKDLDFSIIIPFAYCNVERVLRARDCDSQSCWSCRSCVGSNTIIIAYVAQLDTVASIGRKRFSTRILLHVKRFIPVRVPRGTQTHVPRTVMWHDVAMHMIARRLFEPRCVQDCLVRADVAQRTPQAWSVYTAKVANIGNQSPIADLVKRSWSNRRRAARKPHILCCLFCM